MPLELLICAIYNAPLTNTFFRIELTTVVYLCCSMVVLYVLSCLGLSIMMCLTLPRLLYEYIGILTKSFFFPTHVTPLWLVYVCSCCSIEISNDAHVELDPNFFLAKWCDFEVLQLISYST